MCSCFKAHFFEGSEVQLFEFSNKWMGWEQTAKRDKETGQVVMDVKMPDVPGTDEVLKNAERFYDFVNGTPDKDNK